MTTVKISALPVLDASDATDADYLPAVSSYSGLPTTYRITVAQLRVQLNEGAQTFSGLVTASAGLAATTGAFSGAVSVAAGGVTVTAGGIAVAAGTTAVQALTATTGAFAGAVTLAGSATPNLLYAPTSGATVQAKLGQTADVWSVSQSGGAVRLAVDIGLGIVFVGTAVAASAAAGEIVLPNNAALRGVNVAGTLSTSMIKIHPSNDRVLVDPSVVGTEIGGSLYLNGYGGGTHLVSVGAADSGGAGFKLLRVPN